MFGLLNKIFKISFTVLLINISFGQENIFKNLSFKVDSLINSSINEKAFPGGQVYVKIGDEIVINKSFGYHTYDSIVKVENDHVYDLASLTKVLASTLSIMKISEDYNLDLNEPVSNYITDLKKSNKINTTFVDVLSHTGGWIPYINHHYLLKRKNGKLKKSILRNKKTSNSAPPYAPHYSSVPIRLFHYKKQILYTLVYHFRHR